MSEDIQDFTNALAFSDEITNHIYKLYIINIKCIIKFAKSFMKVYNFGGLSSGSIRVESWVNRTTYEILQILGISLLDKTLVNELFINIDTNDVKELNYNQLSINFI
jgi:hypothetical protein